MQSQISQQLKTSRQSIIDCNCCTQRLLQNITKQFYKKCLTFFKMFFLTLNPNKFFPRFKKSSWQ